MPDDRPILRQAVAHDSRKSTFPSIYGLHHWAFRCRDAKETRAFYEGVLGLPLAAAVSHDYVPSTGEFSPYFHIFFEMGDGSYLAFFDLLDGKGYEHDPGTAPWVNHLALEVSSRQALIDAKARLEGAGVEVLGIVDHKWFDSIYFFDPNGIRLELVFRTASLDQMREKLLAAPRLMEGLDAKRQAVASLVSQPDRATSK
jgi:catechol 2,3-dioxygenase-like lactoylglutathione lyase family enzyme